MHIAVCDDNIADRKHTERLLTRESERIKADSGILYVRSFGHAGALAKAPMPFQLFFIDMTKNGADGLKLALMLCEKGVSAPIVLCVSTIDYRKSFAELPHKPDNILFLDKPINTAALSAIIAQALALKNKAQPKIELRSKNETFYLMEQDIVCGVGLGFNSSVTLADGQTIIVNERFLSLYEYLLIYPVFYRISKNVFVNISYIEQYSPLRISLTSGQHFHISPRFFFSLRKLTKP